MKKNKNEKTEVQRESLFNLEAEQSVLACVLLGAGQAAEEIFGALTVADFHNESHAIIFIAMKSLHDKGLVVDFVTLVEELNSQNAMTSAGGLEYLVKITDLLPSASNYKHYIEILKNLAMKRVLRRFGNYVIEQAQSEKNADELLQDFSEQLGKLEARGCKSELHSAKGAVATELSRIIDASNKKYEPFGLKTGFPELDKALWGLQKSQMFVIGARSGIGKTAFALNIIEYVVVKGGKRCAFFSHEMPESEIVQRLFCIAGGIDNYKIRSGAAYQDDNSRVIKTAEDLQVGELYINDQRGTPVPEMLMQCKRMQRSVGLDLIVIDYIGIINPSNKVKNATRAAEVGEIARGIKGMARTLNVPIILLSQLNRISEDKRPDEITAAYLRESGDIEQEADIIGFLITSDPQDKEVKEVYLKLVKNRHGAMRNFKFKFTGCQFKFEELGVNAPVTGTQRKKEKPQQTSMQVGDITLMPVDPNDVLDF